MSSMRPVGRASKRASAARKRSSKRFFGAVSKLSWSRSLQKGRCREKPRWRRIGRRCARSCDGVAARNAGCFLTSRSDPSGLSRAEAFWNSFDCGPRPQCLSQFQLSVSADSRWVPAPPAKSHPAYLATPLSLWRNGNERGRPLRAGPSFLLIADFLYYKGRHISLGLTKS